VAAVVTKVRFVENLMVEFSFLTVWINQKDSVLDLLVLITQTVLFAKVKQQFVVKVMASNLFKF
jgi:hypothetical protein